LIRHKKEQHANFGLQEKFDEVSPFTNEETIVFPNLKGAIRRVPGLSTLQHEYKTIVVGPDILDFVLHWAVEFSQQQFIAFQAFVIACIRFNIVEKVKHTFGSCGYVKGIKKREMDKK